MTSQECVSALGRAIARGRANGTILPFKVTLGELFVLWCRVSHRNQLANLAKQVQRLREAVEQRGGIVVDVIAVVASGKMEWGHLASELAIAAARANELGAVLLAATTDRFVRNPLFGKLNKDAQARQCDLDDLRFHTDGVRLMTLLDPDASPAECRSWQRKDSTPKDDGDTACTTPRLDRDLPLARAMRQSDPKLSLGKIAKALGRKKAAVQYWHERGWLNG